MAAALGTWGRLDGALVSVGGSPGASVMAIIDEEWTTAFESVFLGAVRLSRYIAQIVRGFVVCQGVRATVRATPVAVNSVLPEAVVAVA